MKSFYLVLTGLVCIGAVYSQAEPSTAEAVHDIDSASPDTYDPTLNNFIPWKQFETAVTAELDKSKDDYSQESANLIGLVKQHMIDALDAYIVAMQSIFEWSGPVPQLLNEYLKKFNDSNINKSAAQRSSLLQVLDDGIEQIQKAQDDLAASSLSFKMTVENLTSLVARLELEFNENSDYFQTLIGKIQSKMNGDSTIGSTITASVPSSNIIPEIKTKFAELLEFYNKLKDQVNETITNIKNTIRMFGQLKVQTVATKEYILWDTESMLKEVIIQAVNDLIAQADAFHAIIHNKIHYSPNTANY